MPFCSIIYKSPTGTLFTRYQSKPLKKTQRMINHFIEQHLQLPPTRLLIKRTINHLEQADHQAGSIKYCIELHFQGKMVLPISIIILFQDNFFVIKILNILKQLVRFLFFFLTIEIAQWLLSDNTLSPQIYFTQQSTSYYFQESPLFENFNRMYTVKRAAAECCTSST